MPSVFASWKRLDQQKQLITTLWLVVGLLCVIDGVFGFIIYHLPNTLTVYIPPDISQAARTTPNHVPKATVYGFAFEVFSAVNTWSDSGTADYDKAIRQYRAYFTPRYYHALKEDAKARGRDGELDRRRVIAGVSGMGFDESRVTVLGPNAWAVDLTVQVQEWVDNAIVKNVVIDYPIKVVRVRISPQDNPYGLALAGYRASPTRVKSLMEAGV